MKHVRKRLDEEYLKSTDEEVTEYAEKEQNCVNTVTEIDASSLLLFDNPHQWDEKIREIYQKHRQHNIAGVRDRLKDDESVPISEKQRGDYFSRAALGMAVAHYPPSSQCGEKTNVAIEVHQNATQKNKGNQILRLKSLCMQTHARFLAGAMGVVDFVEKGGNYAFDYVEYYDDADVKRNARVTMSTITFLQHDFIDRHPTFDDNKVNVEKIIDSKLGMDYRIQGDDLFADLIKYRRAYILTRSANSMGSPTKAPVIVWNAGRVKCDSERTGAQAPMVETFVQKGIDEQLFGIFHPEYLMRTENPVVQVAAEETDLEICRFIEASGGEVRDGDVVRKFVGVAECTPEERGRMARELHETMSALSMLAWMSKGRPGSKKYEIYREHFKKTEDEELSAKLAQQQVMFDGAREAAARFAGLTPEEVAKLDEEGVRGLIEIKIMINDHTFDGTAEAAKSWALKQKVNDTFPFTSLPLVASTQQQQQQSTAAVERYLIKLSEETFESMDKDTKNKLLKDLIAEYCYFSSLEKACKVFDENFDEAKGDTWTSQDRRDIIERYKFLRQGESLGYSLEAVKGMTPEMRRKVKQKYNKKLLLSKLGIEADDGSDDDGDGDGDDTVDGKENLTYAEGMEMTIEEIQTLIVKLEGGKTTKQAIRETCALALGLTEDGIEDLSSADLDKIRVIRLQKGVQKKNIERGLFYLPGTSEHENVVKDICIALRAYGLLILSEQIKSLSEQIESTENAKFLNDWAFKKHTSTIVEYKVYRRAVFKGVVYFERLLDDVLCTGAKKNWHTKNVSLASITQYIYHKRGTFFKGTISPIILDKLPAKNLNSKQLGERTKLQRRIEQNEDHVFKFAGNNDFDTLLKQLAAKNSATFRLFLEKNKNTRPWWYKRVCVQRIFWTEAGRNMQRQRTQDYLYYQDDSGSWLGPYTQWDIVPGQTEKKKQGHKAIVEILNALDERFENVPVASDGGEEEESEEEEIQ